MSRRRKIRDLVGVLKDKASIVKTNISVKRTIASIHIAVLRATTHTSTSPPHEYRLSAILSFGHGSRQTACACIQAIMDRLHNTRSPYVALKCLLVLHNIITRGSFILKDQLSVYPLTGGNNYLNLSKFSNKADLETWELSSWVRWYASMVECNLMVSRVLGFNFSSPSFTRNFYKNKELENFSSTLSDPDLIKELDALVCLVEGICDVPETLHYQRNDLVHEVMLLISDDYRATQYSIMMRLKELGQRAARLSVIDSTELVTRLKRLEDCRKRLIEIFVNRRRNDEFWELISQRKMEFEGIIEGRKRQKLLVWNGTREKSSDVTRYLNQLWEGFKY